MTWQDDWNTHMWPNYGKPPIQISHGNGHEVWDTDGGRYVDLLGGIAVTSLGHGHPAIVQAVTEQVESLSHTSNLYANVPGLELAKELTRQLAGSRVFFCNSGTEANEAALKLVRRKAHDDGKTGVIVAFDNGFHGRSTGSLSLTGQPKYRTGFGAVPSDVVHIPFNDVEALDKLAADNTIIGIFAEPIQGEGGIVPMTRPFADRIAAIQKDGAVLVMDEVQTGIARTGSFFAHSPLGLRPDVVTLAKGLGGGLPIGATLARDELADIMQPGTHGSTFGGNPIACAAACAVLKVVADDNLAARAKRLGDMALEAFEKADITARGAGLLLGIPHDDAKSVVSAMQEQGYLIGTAGTAIRLAPPLTISEDAWMEGIQALIECIKVTVKA